MASNMIAPAGIKSVQSGSASMTNEDSKGITISAVVVAKAFCIVTAFGGDRTEPAAEVAVPAALITDATTLTLYQVLNNSDTKTIKWQVIEFY